MADSVYQDDVLGEDVPFVPETIPSSYRPSSMPAYTTAGAATAPQRDDEMQGILRNMLKQSQTDVQGALTSDKAAEQQYLDSQAWKKKTLQDSYDKLVAQKKDPSEFLLAFSAGMLKPTKTGNFFESLGNAGEAGVPALGRMNQLEQANKKTGLEYQLGMAGVDTDMAKYRSDGALKRATLSQKQGDNAVSMMDRISAREQTQQLARERMNLMELLARDRLERTDRALDQKDDKNNAPKPLSPGDKRKVNDIDTQLQGGELARRQLATALEFSAKAPSGLTAPLQEFWARTFGDPATLRAKQKVQQNLGQAGYASMKQFFGPQMSNADIAAMNRLTAMSTFATHEERAAAIEEFTDYMDDRERLLKQQRDSLVGDSGYSPTQPVPPVTPRTTGAITVNPTTFDPNDPNPLRLKGLTPVVRPPEGN